MTLGKKLKTLRADHNLSQPELAEKIGIEQSYLSKLENDKSIPSNEIFNNMLQAFGLTLEQFLSDIGLGATSAELDRLKQIPDVQQYFSSKQVHNQNKQRRILYVSSLLIVLATTLFYTGYSKQLFSEIQFEYGSQGVIFENETPSVFSRWRDVLTPEQRANDEFVALKKVEIAKRIQYETIYKQKHVGSNMKISVQGGYRSYRLNRELEVKRPVNAWLQLIGVLLFSAGIMGFVLERRLFKSSL